jgi:hypothetical protein
MKALIAAWLTPKGFRAGLNEAGHFGGRNVTIEVFLANGFKQRKNTAEHGSYDPASCPQIHSMSTNPGATRHSTIASRLDSSARCDLKL